MGSAVVDLGTLLEDAVLLREDILHRICASIQLTSTQRERAESAYRGVGRWLEAEGSPFAALGPTIYPQGSMALRTTNKPLAQDEHDLDIVVELNPHGRYENSFDLLDDTRDWLLEHREYASKVDKEDRRCCVRLNYGGNFHLDIVPAFRDESDAGTIWVPDRPSGDFERGNPKGYVAWFEEQCSIEVTRVLLKSVEALPDYDAPEIELPLRRSAQLLKRWRDIVFQNCADAAPSSILLTTLAGSHYGKESSIGAAVSGILDRLLLQVESNPGPLDVRNPIYSPERLSEFWIKDEEAYVLFVTKLRKFASQWESLATTSGLHNLSALLEDLFGEAATRSALTGQQAALVNAPRRRGELAFVPGAATVTSSGTGRRSTPGNTFFGD